MAPERSQVCSAISCLALISVEGMQWILIINSIDALTFNLQILLGLLKVSEIAKLWNVKDFFKSTDDRMVAFAFINYQFS